MKLAHIIASVAGLAAIGAAIWSEVPPCAFPCADARRGLASQVGGCDGFEYRSTTPAGDGTVRRSGDLALHFVENRGQFDRRVDFAVWNGATRAWLTSEGVVLSLSRSMADRGTVQPANGNVGTIAGSIALVFEGARPDIRPIGEDAAPAHFNYFLGSDPACWAANVPSFRSVQYREIHPGIDVVFYEAANGLEYDLLLQPGSRLDDVIMRVDGAKRLHLDATGALVIDTPAGSVIQPRPTAIAMDSSGRRASVSCDYELVGADRVCFRAAGWDGSSRLIIDPSLIFSTFVGGQVNENGYALAIDSDGSVVVSGSTVSVDFPTTIGAFDVSKSWVSDGTVLRLAPDGSTLEFATFLGGLGSSDEPRQVSLDSLGGIVVGGHTSSVDFPTTANGYDTTLDGTADIFVTKFAPDGASLLFSTLIGGPCADSTSGMDLDAVDRIYVGVNAQALGCTSGFPTTSNAFCATPAPGGDLAVARLSSDGTTLEFSSWLCTGGSSIPRDLACDDLGHAYVLGQTVSPDHPVTAAAFDKTFNGQDDHFIAKIDCDVGAVVWWTYLGGASSEIFGAIAADHAGAVYITGQTDSNFTFPVVPGSFDVIPNGGSEAFVAKLSSDGSTLVYSTFLGGGGNDVAHDIAVDANGHAYVTGWAKSFNFPVTPDAFQPTFHGISDSFLCKLSADGSQLLYGTYLGGADPSFTLANGVAVGADVSVAVTGYTSSSDYPTSPGAWDTHLDGFSDAFVARFDLSPWTSLGQGLAGSGGLVPVLTGIGSLQPGSAGALVVQQALPGAASSLVVGLEAISVPFKGGAMVPAPLLFVPLGVDGSGSITLPWVAWPSGLPAGTQVYFQMWVNDPGSVKGWSASNGLSAWLPVIEG